VGSFLLLIQLIPVIIELVRSVERVGDGRVKIGAEKTTFVLEALKIVFDSTQDMPKKITWQTILPMIASIINAFVAFANKTGIFTHTPEADGQ